MLEAEIEDLRAFRQWGARTPGHPERRHTPGIEVTTGPLGQGIANAVGMALGGYAGSRIGARAGDRLLRPALTVCVVLLAIRMLLGGSG